jgi:hypothetical protein
MPSGTNSELCRDELHTDPPGAQSGASHSDEITVLKLRAEIARDEKDKARFEWEKKKLEKELLERSQEASQRAAAPTKSSASVKKSDAINFETEAMTRAVDCLVRSKLYDKDSRMLVPRQGEDEDAAFLGRAYAAVAGEPADEHVSSALEVIAATLYNPRKPSSLYDVWCKAFPLLDPRLILPDHDTPSESPKVCHHEGFKHGAPVLLLWQDVNSEGALDGQPRVVAVGRVLCRAQGAIKCTCEPPAVRIKVVGVREDSEEARNQVSSFMLGEEADDTGVCGLTPFTARKNARGEVEYEFLRSASTNDLQIGQQWQWPRRLIHHDLEREAELAEQAAKEDAKRDKAKAQADKKKKQAKRAEQAAANEVQARLKRGWADWTTGTDALQQQNAETNRMRRAEKRGRE